MQQFEIEERPLQPLGHQHSSGMGWPRSQEEAWEVEASRRSAERRSRLSLAALAALTAVALAVAVAAAATAAVARRQVRLLQVQVDQQAAAAQGAAQDQGQQPRWSGISRIAFGSCSAYDLRPQPIWTQAVIPSRPDAWVWLGDMAYMDRPFADCDTAPTAPGCNCSANWLRAPPHQCNAADAPHARRRLEHQLTLPEYVAFVDFMCPGAAGQAGGPGYPPCGDACPRPVFGMYDDHDFGWNNGDGRNPVKLEIKNIYLDGLGEPAGSARRSSMHGAQVHYTLNSGSDSGNGGGGGVDLLLLDERWYREGMPCSMRAAWCTQVLGSAAAAAAAGAQEAAWCADFLVTGGDAGRGSCCRKDDEWEAWCAQADSRRSAAWASLCDPTLAGFGEALLVLEPDNATVASDVEGLWADAGGSWQRLVEGVETPLCEVLGLQQRRWVRQVSDSSSAQLLLVGSGSVLAGNVGGSEGVFNLTCSGDDWLCWRRAQVNLLHTLANTSAGCVVVLTGDFHFSDIKAILPGEDRPYARFLQTVALRKPVYQVMASGMTESTAHHMEQPCNGTFRQDLVGLRPLGPCSFVATPAFGFVDVDWAGRRAALQIRDGRSGEVALGMDGSRQEVLISLDTCEMV